MWSGSADDDDSAGAPVTSDGPSGAPSPQDAHESQRYAAQQLGRATTKVARLAIRALAVHVVHIVRIVVPGPTSTWTSCFNRHQPQGPLSWRYCRVDHLGFPYLTRLTSSLLSILFRSSEAAALPPWADSNAEARASTVGDSMPPNAVATDIPGYAQNTSKAPLYETSFTAQPSTTQHQHQPHQQKTGAGLESVIVDRPMSGIDGRGGGSLLGNAQQVSIPPAAVAPPNLNVSLASSEVEAEPVGRVSSGSASDGALGLPPPTPVTSDLSSLMTPVKEGRADAGGETSTVVGAPLAVPGNAGDGTSIPIAAPQGDARGTAGQANAPVTVSAAVSEDLAYSHRGSVLQSYAITGSVLVAAGTPARLRVTDAQGHIASAKANAAVAEENTAVSMPPTREYSCKAGAAQPAGAPPKFVPTLLYRCSPAVQMLPVRVNCRLRKAGNAVLVWAQVIANPQLSQALSGVSVLVNLPFSPRDEEVRDYPLVHFPLQGNKTYNPACFFVQTQQRVPTLSV